MRFALLGFDNDVRSVLEVIRESPQHSLVIASTGKDASVVRALFPHVTCDADWESLVSRTDVDAILVARGRDVVVADEQLKKLGQTGVPLLIVHPACDVMLAYELEMMTRDNAGVIVPFAVDWFHPAWKRLAQGNADDSHQTGLERVVFERSFARLDRESVLRQLTLDVFWLRKWLGDVTNVNAAGVSHDDDSFAGLTVHLTGAQQTTARWTATSRELAPDSRVSLTGQFGTVTLTIPSGEANWTLRRQGVQEVSETLPPWNSGEDALHRLDAAISGKAVVPAWSDICLDLEIVDSVKASLRRKRGIDLHLGERSEEKTFKAFMSAAGCLILVVVLLGFLVLAVVEGFRLPMRDAAAAIDKDDAPGWPLWIRLWPVYPLFAFLTMQLLLHLTQRQSR